MPAYDRFEQRSGNGSPVNCEPAMVQPLYITFHQECEAQHAERPPLQDEERDEKLVDGLENKVTLTESFWPFRALHTTVYGMPGHNHMWARMMTRERDTLDGILGT